MKRIVPTIMERDLSVTTSPAATFVEISRWTKRPAIMDDADAKLREQDEWFKANQTAVLRYAQENTRRLTGKPSL